MNVVSLFSGCGGLDYGFEKAGFECSFYNDFDKHACSTLRLNGKKNVTEGPIEQISASDAKKRIGRAVDVLIGGPPCQPFSKSAYWSNGDTLRLEDPRAKTLDHYFRFVAELKPKVFLLENVHGVNYSGKEDGLRYILKKIEEINYSAGLQYNPSWAVLNVAEFGIPQTRIRFFLVAEQKGHKFIFPDKTHIEEKKEQTNLISNKESFVTAWEAIGEIAEDTSQDLQMRGRWSDLLPSIPEGENYLWHTNRKGGLPLFGWRTRYWSFLLKLAKNRPSWTLQATPGPAIGPFHWKNRRLSWQEMAAIQTFPKEFIIDGPKNEIQRQIGNAVPSLMAEILAREIGRQFFGMKYSERPLLNVIRKREIPAPEQVHPVPEKYEYLIGEHQAHPGTGKGAAYRKKRDSFSIERYS